MEFMHHGENMHGTLSDSKLKIKEIHNFNYLIYSYSTLICFVDFEKKIYSINPHKYSVTTSKQINYIREAAKRWENIGYERILWL